MAQEPAYAGPSEASITIPPTNTLLNSCISAWASRVCHTQARPSDFPGVAGHCDTVPNPPWCISAPQLWGEIISAYFLPSAQGRRGPGTLTHPNLIITIRPSEKHQYNPTPPHPQDRERSPTMQDHLYLPYMTPWDHQPYPRTCSPAHMGGLHNGVGSHARALVYTIS